MLLFLGRYVPPHLRDSVDSGQGGYNGPPAGELLSVHMIASNTVEPLHSGHQLGTKKVAVREVYTTSLFRRCRSSSS